MRLPCHLHLQRGSLAVQGGEEALCFPLASLLGRIISMIVKLVAVCKLIVNDEEKTRLLATLSRVNEACLLLAKRAFELKSADKLKLHKLFYRELRERFGLHSQHAVRAISKVCEGYKRDKSKLCSFAPRGAIAFDQRLYTFKHGIDRVSLAMLDGRMI